MKKQHIKAYTKKNNGKLLAIASTEGKDRSGDELKMSDWDLASFKKNPVLQAGHNYNPEYTIGVAEKIRVENNQLVFEPNFHEITQLARDIKAMYEQAVLSTWSVGFIPHALMNPEDTKAKNELLEISAVAVPANAECLTSAKSYGEKEVNKISEWVENKNIKKENKEPTISVNDELDEKKAREEKYQKLNDVDNILYAFYNVYMQKEIAVDKFNELLKETIKLLDNLTGKNKKLYVSKILTKLDGFFSENMKNKTSIDYKERSKRQHLAIKKLKAEIKETKKEVATANKEIENNEIKEGKVLSKKNSTLINTSINSMDETSNNLRKLLEMTSKNDEQKQVIPKAKKDFNLSKTTSKILINALQKISKETNKTLNEARK